MATAKYIILDGVAYSPKHPKVKNYVALPKAMSDKLISKPRLRQNHKPLLNKLETRFYEVLKRRLPNREIRPQAIRFKLGNGIWFKPDFTVHGEGEIIAYEVKGPHAFRGGFENLKVAASLWPCIRWTLVWNENGEWLEQQILP